MLTKHGISPVVATALLLVVGVLAVVSFQTWFESYSSILFAKSEQQSSSAAENIQIENLIGNTLYFKNTNGNNLTITSVKINNIDCNVTSNLSNEIIELNVTLCLEDLSNSTPEVVVYTTSGIYSETFFIKDLSIYSTIPLSCTLNGTTVLHGENYSFYNSSTVAYGSSCSSQLRTCDDGVLNGSSSFNALSCSVSSLNCLSLGLLGGEWITVPGDSALGTGDFCVMKYEAKNVGTVATSQAALTSWTSISQINSRNNCSTFGSKYHLITNAEWTTIARNAEANSINWNSSVVGSGYMFLGHSDGSPASTLNVSNTSNYYDQTLNVEGSGQKRILILNNSEIIWDFSGNVWEWNNNTCSQGDPWYSTAGWLEWTNSNVNGTEKTLGGSIGNYNSANGVGMYYGCTTNGNGFLRGGAWNFGTGGAFFILLGNSPGSVDTLWGFRCVYTP